MPNLTTSLEYVQSAESIAAFVEHVNGKVTSFEGSDRRAHKRYVVAMASVIVPLDEQYRPLGAEFNAATRDISVGGIGLIHTQPITAKFLSVRLTPPNGSDINLLVRVLRCRPLGAYYDIAGEFVTKTEG